MSLECFQSSSFCNFYSDWNFSFQFNFKFLRLKEINEDFPLLVCLNSTIWRIWNESWIFLKVKVFTENFSLCMFFSETKSYNLRNLKFELKTEYSSDWRLSEKSPEFLEFCPMKSYNLRNQYFIFEVKWFQSSYRTACIMNDRTLKPNTGLSNFLSL